MRTKTLLVVGLFAVIAAALNVLRGTAPAVADIDQVSKGAVIDTIETMIYYPRSGGYFKSMQLIPVQTSTVQSSNIELVASVTLDGHTWSAFKTFTDAIAAGVSDTMLYTDLGAVYGVKLQMTVVEYDSVEVYPLFTEIREGD